MSLDERYFLAAPLDQNFVDKDTGEPLAGGTIEFYRDDSRAEGKPVYQITGAPPNYSYVSLGSTITLSSVGTIENAGNDNVALYFYPYRINPATLQLELDLYYIRCFSAAGTLQWTREGWPNVSEESDPTQDSAPIPNQLANPQFTRSFLNTGTTTLATAAGTNSYQIAPDWFLEVDGAANIQLEVAEIQVGANVPSRPPFALDILIPLGITGCRLVQRLNTNSGLWTSTSTNNLYLAGAFSAENQVAAGSTPITMFYREPQGVNITPVQIVAGNFTNAWNNVVGNSGLIPTSTSTLAGNNGYVDIFLDLPVGGHVRVSSIQVIPTNAADNLIAYDSQSSNRELALMGDYYIPAFERKPAKSILQCWDFALNPGQFVEASFTNTATYILDQTIALNSTADAITVSRYQANGFNALQMKTAAATPDQGFLICQYLEKEDIKKLLTGMVSLNINAWSNNAADVTCRVYLYRGSNAATFPTLPAFIGTIATDGQFSLQNGGGQPAENWTEISRSGLGIASVTLNQLATVDEVENFTHDFGFSQYAITDNAELADTDKFAAVVTFSVPTAETEVVVNSISLVPGDIPQRPEPQTYQEVLSDAQKYYEKSIDVDIPWGNALVRAQAGWVFCETVGSSAVAGGLAIINSAKYNVEKRANPARVFKPIEGGAEGSISNMGATNFPGTNEAIANLIYEDVGTKYFGTPVGNGYGGGLKLAFRWKADARLGIV